MIHKSARSYSFKIIFCGVSLYKSLFFTISRFPDFHLLFSSCTLRKSSPKRKHTVSIHPRLCMDRVCVVSMKKGKNRSIQTANNSPHVIERLYSRTSLAGHDDTIRLLKQELVSERYAASHVVPLWGHAKAMHLSHSHLCRTHVRLVQPKRGRLCGRRSRSTQRTRPIRFKPCFQASVVKGLMALDSLAQRFNPTKADCAFHLCILRYKTAIL